MMHQSEFDAAKVALSRAADKRKSLINIHKNRYTATLRRHLLLLIRKLQKLWPWSGDDSSNQTCLIFHIELY